MKIPKLVVTKEHGSWAVVLVPMVVGAGAARRFAAEEVLVFVSVVCVFMSYVPVQMLLRDRFAQSLAREKVDQSRFWSITFGLGAALSGVILLGRGYWLLMLIAGAGVTCFLGNFLVVRFFRKNLFSDLVAVTGLTLGALAVYYGATRTIDQSAFVTWMLTLLFFWSGVFYVHMKMVASGLKRASFSLIEKIRIGKLNLAYHVAMVILVMSFAGLHFIPSLVILAFLPMMVHAFVGTFTLSSHVRYRALGFALLAQSVVFSSVLLLIDGR